ncbi:DNA cytosine methyltransferase [Bradyrhizobium japonicum]|uniref:DNA cytosine methyltransferase n=1 Tax=Bradyrhizobium japonicum TaxID=375 RepID=UPI001BAE37CF|nr:DNA (cytosine-5-)-methyltransferase [Bradyrhizobium japonicum]MBR0804334.1 DNA cytosine methyltransferase [Bradyrhizobium japonicum]
MAFVDLKFVDKAITVPSSVLSQGEVVIAVGIGRGANHQMIGRDKLTVVDLFAGCGGLSLGLEQAGFSPIYVNELSNDARETFLVNRDRAYPLLRSKYFSANIQELTSKPAALGDLLDGFRRDYGLRGKFPVDLVVGGPPCQGYSSVGLRRSYNIDKHFIPSNHLYRDMAKFIAGVRPKAFIFENVAGLLSSRWTKDGVNGEIFKDVLKTFRRLEGYTVKHSLIYSKDYGVPQSRPRVLIVGFRSKLYEGTSGDDDALAGGFLPLGSGRYPDLVDVLSDLADPSFTYGGKSDRYFSSPRSQFQERMRTDTRDVPTFQRMVLREHEYSNHSRQTQNKFKHMIENSGRIHYTHLTKKFNQRLLPEKWGSSGPNITITSLPDDFVHYELARSLTVRECARIQTFPDWYEFRGPRTTGGLRRAGNPHEGNFTRNLPKYTQIANAVPPDLAEAIGRHVATIIRSQGRGLVVPPIGMARRKSVG